MRRRHLRAVLRIENQTQARGWSLGLFLGELARPEDRCYLVAKVGSQVVGFGGMLFIGTDGHVTTISVDPAWRRLGIATRLLAARAVRRVEGGITAVTLEVRAHNREAQALYRAFGFAPVGRATQLLRETDEDALVMWVHDVDRRPTTRVASARLEARCRGATAARGPRGRRTGRPGSPAHVLQGRRRDRHAHPRHRDVV